MEGFHPIIQDWFNSHFSDLTEPQKQGWPAIQAGNDTLIAAPTGSGKTLTAFLVCIDKLFKEALTGNLEDVTRVLYISPLKALSNDIRRNLEVPLAEIEEPAIGEKIKTSPIRVMVRTGDTSSSQRQSILRRPPHILVTTPESFFLLLTAEKSRAILRYVETVIVDEIHSLARDKRGTHLSLSLERLDWLCQKRPQRIGLSATQKPIEEISKFLVGYGREKEEPCTIIDIGHRRQLDIAVDVPSSELSAVCSHDQWSEVYSQLATMVEHHRSTLIFVNTRKLAERLTFHLSEHLGEEAVASHHGSLPKEKRFKAEERLKNGQLKAIVATASLELGIDIGYIDLVVQIGSPRSIAAFLQRIGRAGHAVGATPKGRLIALTRDELIESLALVWAVKNGELDAIEIPQLALDILAQQIVAATVLQEWDLETLFQKVRSAYPYRELARKDFNQVIQMLADGFSKNHRKSAYLHYDAVNQKIRARKKARLITLTNSGAIPEQPLYRVINIDNGAFEGTLHEDFAIESPAGQVFLLGNTSWQIQHVRGTQVSVRDAQGAPPTIPFWIGEAPGRTRELSTYVSNLREEIDQRIEFNQEDKNPLDGIEQIRAIQEINPHLYQKARKWLLALSKNDWVNLQAVHYVAVQKAALGIIPTQRNVIFERFFDESGGMQLAIHAPYGMRINRAWGLALRKRFCRTFNFELQAVAMDDGILLSLGESQSFPIEQLFRFLSSNNVHHLLEQALLQVPFFQARWQWNANRSLAVLRNQWGKRVPPALQRIRSDDLLTAVFPAITQCFEHITGDIDFPDHALVKQTVDDCMTEAMDLVSLKKILEKIENKEVQLIARDTREPSPFSYQLLNAAPYAFLDDAPLEERRARAITQRRTLPMDALGELTKLDEEAIVQVRQEAWPTVRNKDELYDALVGFIALNQEEARDWKFYFDQLVDEGRASVCLVDHEYFWFAIERLPLVKSIFPEAAIVPELHLPESLAAEWSEEDAMACLIQGHLESKPSMSAEELSQSLKLPAKILQSQLISLETKGLLIRGDFNQNGNTEWCHRRLLMRIHRLTLERLRQQIRPVSVSDYLHFLFHYQKLIPAQKRDGKPGLLDTLSQLQGFETAAGEWEAEILPSRIKNYETAWLDELCFDGRLIWGRISSPSAANGSDEHVKTPSIRKLNRISPISLFFRENASWIVQKSFDDALISSSSNAQTVLQILKDYGAQFVNELLVRTGLLKSQLEEALCELAYLGLASADGFSAIRTFISPDLKNRTRRPGSARRRLMKKITYAAGGRWTSFPILTLALDDEVQLEAWAWQLLDRYGVVFRDVLAREAAAPAWSELVRVYRRLEGYGEIRGGRFVSGVSGEQYANADVIEQLRKIRDSKPTEQWVVISAADPLNLIGILTDGPRFSNSRNARLLFKEGRHVATLDRGAVLFHESQSQPVMNRMTSSLKLGGMSRDQAF
ncbi:MAG: DEAD/DEAH box helicase [SAR324 cluster bacterium]|nr:DEAD/DEAH box helicase [SAR324 cluster bacterium]